MVVPLILALVGLFIAGWGFLLILTAPNFTLSVAAISMIIFGLLLVPPVRRLLLTTYGLSIGVPIVIILLLASFFILGTGTADSDEIKISEVSTEINDTHLIVQAEFKNPQPSRTSVNVNTTIENISDDATRTLYWQRYTTGVIMRNSTAEHTVMTVKKSQLSNRDVEKIEDMEYKVYVNITDSGGDDYTYTPATTNRNNSVTRVGITH